MLYAHVLKSFSRIQITSLAYGWITQFLTFELSVLARSEVRLIATPFVAIAAYLGIKKKKSTKILSLSLSLSIYLSIYLSIFSSNCSKISFVLTEELNRL